MINGKIVVHLRAPVLSLSGYGVHSRQIIDYLLSDDRFMVCLESINWGNCAYIHNDDRIPQYYACRSRYEEATNKKIPFDLSIQVTIPNEFQKKAKVNIGVTAGIEVDRCTAVWLQKCNEMDMIVVPSEFSKGVLEKTTAEWKNTRTGETGEYKIERPIVVMPEWFERPEPANSSIAGLGFPTKVNLLHVGQWGNKGGFGEDRKNIADLVRYFFTFFKDREDVGLVLKVNTVNNSEKDFHFTQDKINQIKVNFGNPKCKVYLLHDTLTTEEMWDLYRHPQIHGFISLTHGEGYGLPLLEAAAAGLPVLATDWSGHLDFLRKKNGFIPLDYEMIDIPDCQIWEGVIDKGARWAKVDEKDLKRKWKRFVDSPQPVVKKARENVAWLDDNFSKNAVMKKWREFFDKYRIEPVPQGESPQVHEQKSAKQTAVENLKEAVGFEENDNEKVLFVMPRSAGDVLISTALVDSLIKSRHFEDCDFYYATLPEYKEMLEEFDTRVGYPNVKVVDYHDNMMNNDLTSEIWDVVYNPGINVQYQFSNWRLGNGEYSVKLLAEFAKNCNLHPSELTNYSVVMKETPLPEGDYVTFTPGGSKSAKDYAHWKDVLHNFKKVFPNVKVVQTGLMSEKLYEGVVDYRGKSYRETLFLIKNAKFHFSIDTFTAHAAAAVETPHVVLYGSTDTTVSPTVLGKKTLGILVETTDRHGCKNPCFKDQCLNLKNGRNCISNIDASAVVQSMLTLVEKGEIDLEVDEDHKFEEVFPTISAYTTAYNCMEGGYPFEEAIRSFGWADEVVVVDGGSTDGTREKLSELQEEMGDKLKVYDMPMDWTDPGKDGAQKALSRAMCMYEFCVQFDIDEVCGKDCDVRFKRMAKELPENVDMVSLPIFEFWGPAENWNLRTDRHIWKWRLSRNKPEISHGIPAGDRVEVDGKTYSKGGSDGCFPVNVADHNMIPNNFPNNWFNAELENARTTHDLKKYKELLEEIFNTLPYVKHYSWTNIQQKLTMLRGPWNKFWCELYNKDPESPESNDYFEVAWQDVTDKMIEDKAKELLAQGGQSPAPLLHLVVEE